MPPLLTQTTAEVLQAFLQGVLDGDGCDRGSHLVINTVSEELAIGLFEIGLLLGIFPSFHRWRPSPTTVIEGREVNQAPLYYVKFPKSDPEQYRPEGKVSPERYSELNRRTTSQEVQEAFQIAREAGLYRFDERRRVVLRWV
ncbi:MAG: hypothetical protein HY709_04675 [Candidatus Latescibacteria bacterium]|nr:hypothetical protein [Candidatus Latescibacterota bacterium]